MTCRVRANEGARPPWRLHPEEQAREALSRTAGSSTPADPLVSSRTSGAAAGLGVRPDRLARRRGLATCRRDPVPAPREIRVENAVCEAHHICTIGAVCHSDARTVRTAAPHVPATARLFVREGGTRCATWLI